MTKKSLASFMSESAFDSQTAMTMLGAEGVGLSQQGSFRVIPPGTVTLLEFENNSTNAAAWYAYFKQFEVKASTMLQLAEL